MREVLYNPVRTHLQVRDSRLGEVSTAEDHTACKRRGWNLNKVDLDPKTKLLL